MFCRCHAGNRMAGAENATRYELDAEVRSSWSHLSVFVHRHSIVFVIYLPAAETSRADIEFEATAGLRSGPS